MTRMVPFALALGLALPFVVASPGTASEDAPAKFDDRLVEALAADPTTVRVIVTTLGSPDAAAEAARGLGVDVVWTFDIIDGFSAEADPSLLAALAERDDVERVHLDREVGVLMDVSAYAIGANTVWDAGERGAGVTVAVLDTGLDPLHPSLMGSVKGCVALVRGVAVPECGDTFGHGTHVAGTVASGSATYRGVAPDVELVVVRVLHTAGVGFTSDTIAGMEWVRNHQQNYSPAIRVATMSIGPLSPGCGTDSSPEARAANNLVASGVVFTVAAGNAGHSSCTIDGAAAASRVITVAAVDDKATRTQSDDTVASFSSGGPTADGRLKPDVAFPGVKIRSTYLATTFADMSGTSMATPHAAGAVALLIASEPHLTPDEVKARILDSAVKTTHTGSTPNSVYGHGLGNACLAIGLWTC